MEPLFIYKENGMKELTGIYALYNTGNDKMYIGMSGASINERFGDHYGELKRSKHCNIKLQNAFSKGQELTPAIIYEAKPGTTHLSLSRLERHFVAEYETFAVRGKGYNLTPGGDGTGTGEKHPLFGKIVTEEARLNMSAGSFVDITGHKYHRLVAIKRISKPLEPSRWLCECDCGNKKSVLAGHLVSGKIKSCGCLHS